MKKTMSILGVLVLLFGFAAAADALTINFGSDDLNNISGATLTPSGGDFVSKTVGSTTGVGISGGWEDSELDGKNESILIEFDAPQLIESLVLGFLYPRDVHGDGIYAYGDAIFERALVTINGTDTFTLQATGTTTGTWDGSGVLSSQEAAVNGSGGAWLLTDPFGTTEVTSILFTAPVDTYWRQGKYRPYKDGEGSDYSLVSLSTSPPINTSTIVPVPAAVWLLGSGLLGLVGLRRRRRS